MFEVNLADLKGDEDLAFRKIRLCCEEVEGNSCLTNFHGMDLTRDKVCHTARIMLCPMGAP